MSKEVVAEVIALIELGMIAPEDIAKCLRKANSETEKALAEQPAQQQEPVAWGNFKEDGTLVGLSQHPEDQANWTNRTPLYTSPQPAQRKPLTDEQKRELIKKSELWDMHVHIGWYSAPSKSFVEKAIQLISDIEAAHGIKENT